MTLNLVLTPRHGSFDVDAIREWLDARPDTFEDPRAAGTYFICGLPIVAVREYYERAKDPPSFPRACVAYVTADQVLLVQERGDDSDLRSSMDFLSWMVQHFDCRVRIDGFDDLTDEIRAHGVPSLYPESVRTAPLPWTGSLIPIGFFWELPHGDTTGPSLEDNRQATAMPDELALARYLEAGHVLRRAESSALDMLERREDIDLGPPHQLTDGEYVWPADLPYYLRRYHVRLPRAFVLHARRNDWRVPPVDVATLPAFEV